MKLTGKAFNDFGEQSKIDYKDFIELPVVCQNALIIEWFDSVGIEIYPHSGWHFLTGARDGIDTEIIYNGEKYQIVNSSTRPEATEKAIIKANIIYNERFN